MSRLPIPFSITYFPFLLSIQFAVYSLAKPIEDGSKNDFDEFPALSDLIPDPSHGWRQTTPNFYRLDSQSQIVSQSQPTQDRSGHHSTRVAIDQRPPSPLRKGVAVALARTVFTEGTENLARLTAKKKAQKMELEREDNKEYPKEQHREPEEKKKHKKNKQPQQKKKLQRLHLSGPDSMYMIPTCAKSSMHHKDRK